MNFLNLYYFNVTAEERSFTKAAKRLYISQQSLSSHISKLEDEFGTPLFYRTQPMSMTEAGKILYEGSKVILDKKAQIEKYMRDLKDFQETELVIGVSTSRGSLILPEILPEFHSKFPNIQLRLIEGTTTEIKRALYDGVTDISIGFSFHDEQVHEEELYKERLVCAIPNAFFSGYLSDKISFLQTDKEQEFSVFASCPFIRMPAKSWLGGIFDECCEHYQVNPPVVLETSSMTSMVSLCSAGMGAIILPEAYVKQLNTVWDSGDWMKQVSVFHLNYPPNSRYISISYLKGHYLSKAARELIQIIRGKLKAED